MTEPWNVELTRAVVAALQYGLGGRTLGGQRLMTKLHQKHVGGLSGGRKPVEVQRPDDPVFRVAERGPRSRADQ